MEKDNDLKRNASGCIDTTAYNAIRIADGDVEQQRFNEMLYTIFDICDNYGYKVEGRIVFVDKQTGKVLR